MARMVMIYKTAKDSAAFASHYFERQLRCAWEPPAWPNDGAAAPRRVLRCLRPGTNIAAMKEFALMPDPGDPLPKRAVEGIDHERHRTETRVAVERPLSRFLNGEEIVATRKASLVEGPA